MVNERYFSSFNFSTARSGGQILAFAWPNSLFSCLSKQFVSRRHESPWDEEGRSCCYYAQSC